MGQLRFSVQVCMLHLSYTMNRLRRMGRAKDLDWVVGPFEIALLVHHITHALPNARSAVLARHPYYTVPYDWELRTSAFPGVSTLRSWLLGPAKLGQMAARTKNFVYVGPEGFLDAGHDHREHEFKFLKRRGCRVVCYFTGNDIRSPKLMRELEERTGRPNLGTYLSQVDPVFATDAYDDLKREIAETADRYADAVFNADVDQRGYLKPGAHPFLYFYPDEEILDSFERFSRLDCPVIVHAPSSPILKGTQLVRAAIAQLRAEGYVFEYVELTKVPNAQVRLALSRAHIALNEFYASMPGVFSVEAMAAGCAVLTSADEAVEPQLPEGSNQAWVVTAHHQVTTNLRQLLDHPERIEPQARAGNAWVRAHAAASVTGPILARTLDAIP